MPVLPPAADAVVVGAGHHGLVAAALLADAGWDVVVVEAAERVGGAVASDSSVLSPGFVADLYSAFYPLAAASPTIQALDLESCGLAWSHAPAVLAHPLPDGRCALLSRDVDATAASVERFAAGDGDAWRAAATQWSRLKGPLLDALLRPFPPVRGSLGLLGRLRAAGLLPFARQAALSARRLTEEMFGGAGAGLLVGGNALHADLSLDDVGSGLFGWLLAMLGQDVGFPVPVGGAGRLAEALAERARRAGAVVLAGCPVTAVRLERGRVAGVQTPGGLVRARRAVLADVPAPTLFGGLLPRAALPPRMRDRLDAFAWDDATVKVNWALSEPIPWLAAEAAAAGTVHLGGSFEDLARFRQDLDGGRVPRHPFLILGQMTTADPSRSPAGTESAWAYSHVPRTSTRNHEVLIAQVRRLEDVVEQYAPGFGARVLSRHIQLPEDLERGDPSLVGGAINGGTAKPYNQLVFRPWNGLARPETPVPGLYLASSSAHPGGGVHGACGANAARAALLGAHPVGRVGSRLLRDALRLVNSG